MPFVQGHLRDEALSVTFETECAHCSQPMTLEVDSELRHRVSKGYAPLIFLPIVDFAKLQDPSIIDAF